MLYDGTEMVQVTGSVFSLIQMC